MVQCCSINRLELKFSLYLRDGSKMKKKELAILLGLVLILLLALHRLTGDARYLARGQAFGKTSVAIFFDGSPLPRASSKHDHYEAITRADTLAMALLDLWAAEHKPNVDLGFIYPER